MTTLRTKAGSTVDGNQITFDWLEEGGCIDCEPEVIDGMLVWHCEHCGGGSAELYYETPDSLTGDLVRLAEQTTQTPQETR